MIKKSSSNPIFSECNSKNSSSIIITDISEKYQQHAVASSLVESTDFF